MRSKLGGGDDRPRLEISQSLGAFARPGGEGISPLYVFFEVTNKGTQPAEISHHHVAARKDPRPVYDGPFDGDDALPYRLDPGQSVRFWTRAKSLAGALKRAGHDGRPRIRFVAEDSSGNTHEKTFRFRVDDYLRLKDE